MTTADATSRQTVYAAISRQSPEVQSAILAEGANTILRGQVKHSNGKRKIFDAGSSSHAPSSKIPRRVDAGQPNAERATGHAVHTHVNSEREVYQEMDHEPIQDQADEIEFDWEHSDFMKVPSQEVQDKRINEFIYATGNEALSSYPCGSCARQTPADSLILFKITNIPNVRHLQPNKPHPAHELTEGFLIHPPAISPDKHYTHICSECMTRLKKDEKPPLSLANDMWIGEIPYQLRNLSLAERTMITKSFSSVYIFKLYPKRKGAENWNRGTMHSGIMGNVSTYKMDPAQMASIICDNVYPHPSKILSQTIGVTFVGPKGVRESTMPGMLMVRRWRVRDALLWLKANNPLYSDIIISEDRLSELPVEGVPQEILLTAKYSSDIEALNKEREGYVPEQGEGDENVEQGGEEEDDDDQGGDDIDHYLGVNGDTIDAEDDGQGLADETEDLHVEHTDPVTIAIQALGVVDIEGDDITSTEIMAHAMTNNKSKGSMTGENFRIERGSAFVNEYARIDPTTRQRNDGGPSNPNHLLGCFPTLFPYGKGGFEINRVVDVPYETHARWSLNYSDKRFRKDPQFPFQIFGVCQKRAVCRSSVLQMKKSHFTKHMELISTLKPEDLIKASIEETRGIIFRNPAVRALRQNLTAIRSRVKGTDESRQHVRSKIWATNLIFNPPSIWITINPADSQDPIAQVFAGEDIDLDAFCDTAGPTSAQRASNIASDPFASAQFFHFIIQTIIEVLFGIRKNGSGRFDRVEGILGYVQSYIGTVEAQGRGTLHLHMLIWLKDAPTAAQMQEALKTDAFRERVAAYIGAVVKADLNGMTTEEVTKIPKGRAVTYSRPTRPSLLNDEQKFELHKTLARTLQLHVCSTESCLIIVKQRRKCKRRAPFTTADRDWINELGEWGPKRTCEMLNAWNTTIMTCIRSNHDIKLIINGRMTAKLTFYVTNYATKKQSRSSNASALLADKLIFHAGAEKKQTDLNMYNKRLIQRCANSLSRYREFSAPEVISYIMGWKDTYESHTYVTMFSDSVTMALCDEFPELQPKRSGLPHSSETSAPDTIHTLHIVGDRLELKDQLKDYQFRGEELSSMSFLEFILNTYEGEMSEKDRINTDAIAPKGPGRPCNDRHEYLVTSNKGSRCRVIRTADHETLPRICGTWFSRNDKSNECLLHHAQMLSLFKPWRQLRDLKLSTESFDDAYRAMLSIPDKGRARFISNVQYYYECLDSARRDEAETNNTVVESRNRDGMEVDIPSTVIPLQDLTITEDDIDRAKIMRTKARERLFGQAAIHEAYNASFFTDKPSEVMLEPVALRATEDDADKIRNWEAQLQVTTRARVSTAKITRKKVATQAKTMPSTSKTTRAKTTAIEPKSSNSAGATAMKQRPERAKLNEEQIRAHDIIENTLQKLLTGR